MNGIYQNLLTDIKNAIEFALFGLGNQKGASLLRMGTNEGYVTLRFEVDGKEYEVHRSLVRRGKRVQQGEGYIKSHEGKRHLSPSELKQEVLSILKFNEPPNPKAQSVIYRYAVYTPQEEMKAILWARADQRLQTLRKAFRIEDYRIATDNASNLARTLEKKATFLKGQADDLEEKKKALKEKQDLLHRLESKESEFPGSKDLYAELPTRIAQLEAERNEIRDQIRSLVAEIKSLRDEIESEEAQLMALRRKIEKLENQAAGHQRFVQEAGLLLGDLQEGQRFTDAQGGTAVKPDKRVFPKRTLMTAIGMLVSFLLFCVLAFFLEIWPRITADNP